MVSNEPKEDKDIKGWEEVEQVNSIKEPEPSEQAELSEIETGSKGVDFDEMISFSHTYLNYRYADCFPSAELLREKTFGLLMTNVFIYSGNIIDIKSMANMSNSESVKNMRNRLKSYKTQDISEKITFIENIAYYVKSVGFQETAESILPILSDLPNEKDSLILKQR